MAVSKEVVSRIRQADMRYCDIFALDASDERPISYFVNASESYMKPKKIGRSPKDLSGCRVRLDDEGAFMP